MKGNVKIRRGRRSSEERVHYAYRDRKANKKQWEKWREIADGKDIKMKND